MTRDQNYILNIHEKKPNTVIQFKKNWLKIGINHFSGKSNLSESRSNYRELENFLKNRQFT